MRQFCVCSFLVDWLTLKMKATRYFETSGNSDTPLHRRRRASYKVMSLCATVRVEHRSTWRHTAGWPNARQWVTWRLLATWRSVLTSCTNRLNIQKFYVLPKQCIYVFCLDLRTNSDYFPIHHKLTGFYNRVGVCLLRGTDWVFIYVYIYIYIYFFFFLRWISARIFSRLSCSLEQLPKWCPRCHVAAACFSCRPFDLSSSKLFPAL